MYRDGERNGVDVGMGMPGHNWYRDVEPGMGIPFTPGMGMLGYNWYWDVEPGMGMPGYLRWG